MFFVKDLVWKKGMTIKELNESLSFVGFQSTELARATKLIKKMKKENAKIIFTFTSNLVTSGLRGFFAQVIKYGFADIVITTAGAIEEDIMKAFGEKFIIGSFDADDYKAHEDGLNRVGNLFIKNDSYLRFEGIMKDFLRKAYEKKKEWKVNELLKEFGLMIKDENSFLRQAALKNVPVFCPSIMDGAIGFHLFLFKQDNPDFRVKIIKDFEDLIFSLSYDDRKGLIALGGGVSKHFGMLAGLINGGFEYAVYVTTSRQFSGSLSGAKTKEAKSWGKIRDDADAVTVIGDATVFFPLIMIPIFEEFVDG